MCLCWSLTSFGKMAHISTIHRDIKPKHFSSNINTSTTSTYNKTCKNKLPFYLANRTSVMISCCLSLSLSHSLCVCLCVCMMNSIPLISSLFVGVICIYYEYHVRVLLLCNNFQMKYSYSWKWIFFRRHRKRRKFNVMIGRTHIYVQNASKIGMATIKKRKWKIFRG